MLIRSISAGPAGNLAQVSATVVWEDCSFGRREVFFATDSALANDLAPDPNAFLLAAFIPAMRFGEHRILVEGKLCPQLRDGVGVVVQQLRKWYGGDDRPFVVEAGDGFSPSPCPARSRTACCMSGGIDSLASFRNNRLGFPLHHPRAVQDLLFIHGFDLGGHEAWDANQPSFARARQALERFARQSEAEVLPIFTNIRFLEESAPGTYYTDLFVLQSFGACLAACAHAFSPRLTELLVPSSHDVMDLEPLGSHPLLDPNYSSSSLTVRHDGLGRSRMAKTQSLHDWDEALHVLRVCSDPTRPADAINCGRCEKCVRTMVSLLILGSLHRCPTFPADDVSPDDINRLWWVSPGADASRFGYLSYGSHHFWEQLVGPLERIDRRDLAEAVRQKLAERRRLIAQMERRNRINKVDRKFFGGAWGKLRRRLRQSSG